MDFSPLFPSFSLTFLLYIRYDFLDSCVRLAGVCVALVVMAVIVAPVTMLLKPLSYYMAKKGE
jgi:predicted PurR-regulated permease PerM